MIARPPTHSLFPYTTLFRSRGAVLIGMLDPFNDAGLQKLATAGITAFALEAAPRISRAQSLDVLSSQANIAGYKAVRSEEHTSELQSRPHLLCSLLLDTKNC